MHCVTEADDIKVLLRTRPRNSEMAKIDSSGESVCLSFLIHIPRNHSQTNDA